MSSQPFWQEPVEATPMLTTLSPLQRFAIRLGWSALFAVTFVTLTITVYASPSLFFVCFWLSLEIAAAIGLISRKRNLLSRTLDGTGEMYVILMDEYLLIDAGRKHRFTWWRWLSIQRQLRSHNLEHSLHRGRRTRHIWATHVPRVPEQIRFYTYPASDRLKHSTEVFIQGVIKQAFRMRLPNGIEFQHRDNRGHIDSLTEERRI